MLGIWGGEWAFKLERGGVSWTVVEEGGGPPQPRKRRVSGRGFISC